MTNKTLSSKLTSSLLVAAGVLFLAAPASAQQRPVRFLANVGAEAGVYVDQRSGLLLGANLALGVDIRGFQLFGLSQGFVGPLISGPNSGHMTGVMWNSLMIGFAAGPLRLAAGPSMDFAWGCNDTNSGAECYTGNGLFGIDVRAGLALGNLLLSIDVHPTFYRSRTVTGFVLGIGWTSV